MQLRVQEEGGGAMLLQRHTGPIEGAPGLTLGMCAVHFTLQE